VKLKCGTIEIRPAADISEMMRESERRRRKDYLAMRAAARERMISIMALVLIISIGVLVPKAAAQSDMNKPIHSPLG
jgi:hypothetical protein